MQTNAELAYLDSSALVKLIETERETPALRAFLAERPGRVSAALARVEVVRAAGRRGPDVVAVAQTLLDGLEMIKLTDDLLDAAGRLDPPALHSLDAIHISAALALQPASLVFISYDERQAAAARSVGLRVVAPD